MTVEVLSDWSKTVGKGEEQTWAEVLDIEAGRMLVALHPLVDTQADYHIWADRMNHMVDLSRSLMVEIEGLWVQVERCA